MSWAARLEERWREEAFQDAPRRAQELGARLAELEAASARSGHDAQMRVPRALPADVKNELVFLERLLVAADDAQRTASESNYGTSMAQRRSLQQPSAGWGRASRRVSDPLPAVHAPYRAPLPDGFAATVGDLRCRATAFEQSSQGTSTHPGTACPDHESLERLADSKDDISSDSVIGPVASFLLDDDSQQGEDEVRLLCAERQLVTQLHQYPTLHVKDTESSLVFRTVTEKQSFSFRPWDARDDEEERERERRLVLQLNENISALRDLSQLVAEEVDRATEELTCVEQKVAETRENADQVVKHLVSATRHNEGVLAMKTIACLVPSVSAVVLGLTCGPTGVMFARGVLLLGAATCCVAGVSKWQERALIHMQKQLPTIFEPVPQAEVSGIRAAGVDAQSQLLATLEDESGWYRVKFSLSAIRHGLDLYQRPSISRPRNRAYMTSFSVPMPAKRVYQICKNLSMSQSMDPDCKVIWSRPLDGEGTSVRYLIFSNWLVNRDFFLVSRCGPLPIAEGSVDERYAFAEASLPQELLGGNALPKPDGKFPHGHINILGFRITGGGESSKVEVLADVDPQAPAPFDGWVSDRDVRLHLLRSAVWLQEELISEAKWAD